MSSPPLIRSTTLAEVMKRREERSGGSQLKRPRSSSAEASDGTCRLHQRPLDVYCCTDEQTICALCAAAEHTGHRIGVVMLEQRKKREELKKIQEELKRILQEQKRSRENMEKLFEQIEEEVQHTEDRCEGVIVGVIEGLQNHFLSVRKMIKAQAEAAAAQVKVSLQMLQLNVEELKEMDAELDRLAQNQNNLQFLQKWPDVRRICNENLHLFSEDSEDPLSSFKVTEKAVKKLGRQLEEFCDLEFSSIYNTPDRAEQEESDRGTEEDERIEDVSQPNYGLTGTSRTEERVEPTTREEFLQYACDLSLDPTTAHKDLIISEGDTKVTLCSEKWNAPINPYPQRFIHRRQVLCREELQADKCYYEVEVEGGKSEIALTYEGIDRKSNSKTSAFGGNAKSWSLDRSNFYSVSHRADSIQLKARPSQKRVGVYLNFNEGTLSFYEVLDGSMMFLYKVEAEFTEALYPGFWIGDKCSIKICDLRQERVRKQ